ncbi:MAG: signal transduction histidine kinase [Verrucomicrobiales bacterium]
MATPAQSMEISKLPSETSSLTRTAAHSPSALRLSLLFDALVWVAKCPDVDTLLEGLATRLGWTLVFDRCLVARTVGSTVDIHVLTRTMDSPDSAATATVNEQEKGIVRRVITSATSERVPEEGGDHAYLGLPLQAGEQPIGVLLIAFPDDSSYTEENIAYAEAAATYLALALDRLTQMRDLQHANRALERSNLELQQFAYIASHDLQTPLRSISGFIQLLQKRYGGELDEQADDWIERAVNATANLQNLINDLLVYSRVETRARPFEPVDLNRVLADAYGMIEASVKDGGGEVMIGQLPKVLGDRAQLVQLFQNLLDNAVKYHREGVPPEVIVTAAGDGEEWVLSITDNGIGIKKEHQERIFEIFRRLHGPNEYPGTGIGLAVCRRLVHRHTGRVWIEKSTPGVGSVFCVGLPDRGIPQEDEDDD